MVGETHSHKWLIGNTAEIFINTKKIRLNSVTGLHVYGHTHTHTLLSYWTTFNMCVCVCQRHTNIIACVYVYLYEKHLPSIALFMIFNDTGVLGKC